MKDRPLFLALIYANLGTVVLTLTLQPKKQSYSYSNPIEAVFVSRTSWDLVWGITLASVLFSCAFYRFVTSRTEE